jgi:hypothetical protein
VQDVTVRMAAQIDGACGVTDQRSNLAGRAHLHDASVADGERLRDRVVRIDREDLAVGEDDICSRRPRGGRNVGSDVASSHENDRNERTVAPESW